MLVCLLMALRIMSKQSYRNGTDKVRTDLFLYAFLDNGKGGIVQLMGYL